MIYPDPKQPYPKADSFSLYCNWIANRMLLNILPKTNLNNKLHKMTKNSRKLAIASNPNNYNN